MWVVRCPGSPFSFLVFNFSVCEDWLWGLD